MFVVLLRFPADKSQAPDHMADRQEWIRQDVEDGAFLLVGSLQPAQGGAVPAHRTPLDELQERVAADPSGPGIVRHRGKIEAVVGNARRAVGQAHR
ncbi:hypothetical protein [Streptomyces sp. NPDC003863]